jgi:hypothetical protein
VAFSCGGSQVGAAIRSAASAVEGSVLGALNGIGDKVCTMIETLDGSVAGTMPGLPSGTAIRVPEDAVEGSVLGWGGWQRDWYT